MIETNVTYVPGDEFYCGACITSNTRIYNAHIWHRAILHLTRMLDVEYKIRDEAILDIVQYMRYVPPDDLSKRKKPPQFSWKGIPGKL